MSRRCRQDPPHHTAGHPGSRGHGPPPSPARPRPVALSLARGRTAGKGRGSAAQPGPPAPGMAAALGGLSRESRQRRHFRRRWKGGRRGQAPAQREGARSRPRLARLPYPRRRVGRPPAPRSHPGGSGPFAPAPLPTSRPQTPRLPWGETPPPPSGTFPGSPAASPSRRAAAPLPRAPPPGTASRGDPAPTARSPALTFSQRLFTWPSESCLHSLSCSTHWSSSLVNTFSSIPRSPSSSPAAAAPPRKPLRSPLPTAAAATRQDRWRAEKRPGALRVGRPARRSRLLQLCRPLPRTRPCNGRRSWRHRLSFHYGEGEGDATGGDSACAVPRRGRARAPGRARAGPARPAGRWRRDGARTRLRLRGTARHKAARAGKAMALAREGQPAHARQGGEWGLAPWRGRVDGGGFAAVSVPWACGAWDRRCWSALRAGALLSGALCEAGARPSALSWGGPALKGPLSAAWPGGVCLSCPGEAWGQRGGSLGGTDWSGCQYLRRGWEGGCWSLLLLTP